MKRFVLPVVILSLLLSWSCKRDAEEMEGPTIGRLDILADENCKYIIEQEEQIFERNYKYAHLNITYTNEHDLMQAFLADSIKVIMTTRTLTEEEKAYCNQRNAHPREIQYATSAIAFAKNKKATDTVYVYEELLRLFGDTTSGTIFVLENEKSGISKTVMDLMQAETLPSHFYAFDTKQEVLKYIEEHDHAIGIIDYSDISDSDSALTREVLAKIRLLGISRPADSTQVGFVQPYQYNLQDDKYPFTRDLYYISQSGKSDVGIGFASFICGEIGQKIILKSGLLPTFQTERILEINYTDDIKVVK